MTAGELLTFICLYLNFPQKLYFWIQHTMALLGQFNFVPQKVIRLFDKTKYIFYFVSEVIVGPQQKLLWSTLEL